MTYHELETFNGDSSSVVVHEPYFALSNLQPGRNYSISIQAVSNGIESVDRSIFQATSEYPISTGIFPDVWERCNSQAVYGCNLESIGIRSHQF